MIYDSYQDEQLVDLLKNDQQEALTELYRRYWKSSFIVAANKCNDLSLAEELVQDIFTDLWLRRAQIQLKGKFSHYLAAAVKYKVIDARYRKSRQPKGLPDAALQLAGNQPSAIEQLQFQELQEKLAALVAGLPEKCQLVFRLSREAGHSHRQIAQQLNLSEKTVEYHLSRALKALRSGLQQLFSLLLLTAVYLLSGLPA